MTLVAGRFFAHRSGGAAAAAAAAAAAIAARRDGRACRVVVVRVLDDGEWQLWQLRQ